MEALLLFCCRSCLKGDTDKEYYNLLGIEDYNCSLDDIKKAYKKKSLQLHPDRLAQRGIQVTPEHNQQFQKLKEAYDVLSDPRKRRLYDKIGKSGLKLIDSPQEVDPKELIRNFQQNEKDRRKLILVILLIFACILILPILFSLKCDGKLDNVPWLAIWTPMWVVNSVFVISAILFLIEKEDYPEEEEELAQKPEKTPFSVKFIFASKTFSFVLLQIFVLMKLDDEISWNWFKIFAPWFIYEFFGLIEKLPGAYVKIGEIDLSIIERSTELDDQEKKIQKIMIETEHFRKTLEKFMMKKSVKISILRVWLAIFLALQLDDIVEWDWGLVMLPIWLYFFLELVHGYRLRKWGATYLENVDVDAIQRGEVDDPTLILKAQHGQELVAAGSVGCCFIFPTLFMAVLLVSRLEAAHFTTFVIILPVFIFIGCCMCGVCCGLCALSSYDTSQLDSSERGSDDPASRMMKQESYTPPPIVEEDIENKFQETKTSNEYGTYYQQSNYSVTSPIMVQEESKPTPSTPTPAPVPVSIPTTTTTTTTVSPEDDLD